MEDTRTKDIPSTSNHPLRHQQKRASYKKHIQCRVTSPFVSTKDFRDLHNPFFPKYPYAFDDPSPSIVACAKESIAKINHMPLRHHQHAQAHPPCYRPQGFARPT